MPTLLTLRIYDPDEYAAERSETFIISFNVCAPVKIAKKRRVWGTSYPRRAACSSATPSNELPLTLYPRRPVLTTTLKHRTQQFEPRLRGGISWLLGHTNAEGLALIRPLWMRAGYLMRPRSPDGRSTRNANSASAAHRQKANRCQLFHTGLSAYSPLP